MAMLHFPFNNACNFQCTCKYVKCKMQGLRVGKHWLRSTLGPFPRARGGPAGVWARVGGPARARGARATKALEGTIVETLRFSRCWEPSHGHVTFSMQ